MSQQVVCQAATQEPGVLRTAADRAQEAPGWASWRGSCLTREAQGRLQRSQLLGVLGRRHGGVMLDQRLRWGSRGGPEARGQRWLQWEPTPAKGPGWRTGRSQSDRGGGGHWDRSCLTLRSPVPPQQTVIVGSYLIAHGFFSVYGMCVDTLFLCFCKWPLTQPILGKHPPPPRLGAVELGVETLCSCNTLPLLPP